MTRTLRKTPVKTVLHLQKILTTFGLAVIALTIVATMFTLTVNPPYIADLLGLGYYARYAIVLIGGFGAGALFTYLSKRKIFDSKAPKSTHLLFTGVIFGLFTYSLWLLLDAVRVFFQDTFNGFGFPWAKIAFEGLPFFALGIVVLGALYVVFRKGTFSPSHRWLQWIFIGVFVLQQASSVATVMILSSSAEFSAMTILIGLLGALLTPLTVALLTYLALRGVNEKRLRLFFATVIGLLYQTMLYNAWEFQTDTGYQATLVFSIIASITTYAATVTLVLFAWRATHIHPRDGRASLRHG